MKKICRKCGVIVQGEFSPKNIKIKCLGNSHEIENIGRKDITIIPPIKTLAPFKDNGAN